MSKRLSNSKRLQLINKWLRGIDDEDFEVFPCKTEGKYFVRPRKNKLKQTTKDINVLSLESEEVTEPESIQEEPEEIIEELRPGQSLEPKAKSISKPRAIHQTNNQFYDLTINIEILNQLKLLGEEFKNEREKKEQKRIIKEAVQKQISRRPFRSEMQNIEPRMQYNYSEPDYIQQSNLQQEEIQQNVLRAAPILTRKNNIFADIM